MNRVPSLAFAATLMIGVACTTGGGIAPSADPSTAAAGVLATPLGRERTTIASWADPRSAAWTATYPLFAPATTGDGSLKRVQDAGNIDLCAQTTIRPMVYVDPKSNYVVGAEPDMMAEVAKRLGIRAYTYHRVAFAARVPPLVTGRCDAFISGIAATGVRARWEGVKFTAPYRLNHPVIVVSEASVYQTASDLRGTVLTGWRGSDAIDYAHQLAKELGGGTTVVEVFDEGSAYRALSSGAAAAYVDNLYNIPPTESLYSVRTLPDLVRFVPAGGAIENDSPYHYGALAGITRVEDGDLNLALSVAFAEMINDGTLRRILNKWHVDSAAAFDLIRPEAR